MRASLSRQARPEDGEVAKNIESWKLGYMKEKKKELMEEPDHTEIEMR